MPEHTVFSVGYRRVFGGCDGLFDGEILVIARENLKRVRVVDIKANKVLEDIQKPLFFKDTLEEDIELSVLGVLVAAVLDFPLHKAVFACGNGAGFGCAHITHHADCIIDKQRGDFIHIVAQLTVGFGRVGFLTGGRF